jgi:hypothetical protein
VFPLLAVLEEASDPQLMRHPQLTRLQLRRSQVAMRDIMTMVSQLPQLEVLEVLDQLETTVELQQINAAMLTQLPQLREVNLSGSLLGQQSQVRFYHNSPQATNWPLYVTEQLLALQRAVPRIAWVLRGAEGSSP